MNSQRIGATVRAVRIRRRWRQLDVAQAANVSRATVSRIERGHLEGVTVLTLQQVAAALEIRLQVDLWWHGADRDRLLNARHSAMHELVARTFAGCPGWIITPEVSFSVYGERGVIDIVAWHPATRSLLVVELKTEISDVQELVGTLDRKRRLAPTVAREHAWDPATVSSWVIVAASMTNRRRVDAHGTMLRAAFPAMGRGLRSWLKAPSGSVRGLSFVTLARSGVAGSASGARRVHRRRASAA